MKKAMSLILSVLFCTSVVMAEAPAAFEFPSGVTWEMTAEEIKEKENVPEAEAYEFTDEAYPDYTVANLIIEDAVFADLPATQIYVLSEDSLIYSLYGLMDDSYQPDAVLANITDSYGEPEDVDYEKASAFANRYIGHDLISQDDLNSFTFHAWTLEDDTYLVFADYGSALNILFMEPDDASAAE